LSDRKTVPSLYNSRRSSLAWPELIPADRYDARVLESRRRDGSIRVKRMRWNGAPQRDTRDDNASVKWNFQKISL
jgi:hypothetical protein